MLCLCFFAYLHVSVLVVCVLEGAPWLGWLQRGCETKMKHRTSFSYFAFVFLHMCMVLCFLCLGLCLRRHTLAWLVGERLWDKDERSNSGFHPSSPTWSLFNFSYCIILELCIFMAETFFRCHRMSFSPHGGPEVCFKKLSSAMSECLIKFARFSPPLVLVLFGQLWALFAPTMCSGPQCLHPQWSSMSSLLLVWQLPVQATSTIDTLALYNSKSKTLAL